MKKILVIRFSSIGDIVLTTPVLRCIRQCLPNVELHFLTRKAFEGIVSSNPTIEKVHSFEQRLSAVIPALKNEKFDLIIDLHKNWRSLRVKLALGVKSIGFNKLNVEKWLYVNLKKNKLPNKHIVDRYFDALSPLGVRYDGQGLDYFIPSKDKVDTQAQFGLISGEYLALVVGAAHYTKRIPIEKLIEISAKSTLPIVCLGGKDDVEIGEKLAKAFPLKVKNACGMVNLNQSASLVQQAKQVITADTGLMHIAAAFQQNIVVLWGNTTPQLGMYPFLESKKFQSLEVPNLACRPCSKIGYKACPKKHFACMQEQNIAQIHFASC